MDHLRPFINFKCRQTGEVSIKARYLHRAFISYLEEHNESPIDRKTFIEWMSQIAHEFTYDSKTRIFHGLELECGNPSKKRSSDTVDRTKLITSDGYIHCVGEYNDEKRRKSPLIIPADNNNIDNEILTVDPLMFIDRTSMPPIQDPILTKDVFVDYQKWNLSERNRLHELEKLASSPDIKHTINGLEITLERELQIIQTRYENSMINPVQQSNEVRVQLRTPRVRREGPRTRRGILSDRIRPSIVHNQQYQPTTSQQSTFTRTQETITNNQQQSTQDYQTVSTQDYQTVNTQDYQTVNTQDYQTVNNDEMTPLLHSFNFENHEYNRETTSLFHSDIPEIVIQTHNSEDHVASSQSVPPDYHC